MRMLKPLQRCPGVSKFVSTLETSSVFMNNKTLNLEIQYDEILICIDFWLSLLVCLFTSKFRMQYVKCVSKQILLMDTEEGWSLGTFHPTMVLEMKLCDDRLLLSLWMCMGKTETRLLFTTPHQDNFILNTKEIKCENPVCPKYIFFSYVFFYYKVWTKYFLYLRREI